MQLDDGGKYPAVVAFTATAVKRLLLALDEGGQGIGQILITARQDFERDEDLLKAGLEVRFKKIIGEIAAFELEQVMQAEGEQFGAQAIDFVLEGSGKHTRDIAPGEGEHGSGKAAAFERLVGEAEAGGDELGAEDLVAAGTPFAIIFIGPQDGKARAVTVVEDLDHIGPVRGVFEVRFVQHQGAAVLVEDTKDR